MKAIELNLYSILIHIQISNSFCSKKENKKAEDYFKKALHLSPKICRFI